MTMQDQLRLALLGKPKFERNDQPLSLTSVKGQALLAYLAVTHQPHSRSALAGLLWSDRPEADARSNLRVTLSQLRKVVGDVITATRRTVALNPDSNVWLDVTVLEEAARSGHDLATVAALYQGDFLDDFQVPEAELFEEWVLVERERLRQIVLSVLGQLADQSLEQGAYAVGIDAARRLLSIEPWLETGHQQLMRLLVTDGQRSAALAQYETCRQLLADELGVEPTAETIELYEQIRAGVLSRGTEAQESRGETIGLPAFLSPISQSPNLPPTFVARERELQQLDRHFKAAVEGQGRVVFVTGEAGQGKTSLMNGFARRIQTDRAEVIVAGGTCHAYAGVGDPYLPFRDILGMLTGDVEAQWAAGMISQAHARQLWTLLPQTVQAIVEAGPALIDVFVSGAALQKRAEINTPGGAAWLPLLQALVAAKKTDTLEQAQLFEQYTTVLRRLADQQPLLLLLDDLQWADKASVNLLFHLGRRLAGSRILILGAYRPSEVIADSTAMETTAGNDPQPLQPVIQELTRQFGDIEIDLSRLSQAEGRGFVDALLDSQPNRLGESFRGPLFQKTQGHPLFTVELLREMQARGDVVQDESQVWVESGVLDWQTLPARVEAVIEKRIGRLDADLRAALTVASIEGEEFTAEVVAQVQGIEVQPLVRRLSGEADRQHRLVTAQGVRRLDSGRLSRYRFGHNLFQSYLYHRLDEVERCYLHESVGLALEALYGAQVEQVAGQLARHFQMAGLASQAGRYLQLAGDGAARVHAHAEAISYYRQALDLVKQGAADGDLSVLYTRLGRALELIGQFEAALATYQDMERLARERNDRSLELAALIRWSTLLILPTSVLDMIRAEALAERGLPVAQALEDTEAETTLWKILADTYRNHKKIAKAIDAGERALTLARQTGLREQLAFVLNDQGQIYWMTGNFERAKEALQEAQTLWQDLDNLPMLTDSLATFCATCVHTGDYDQAVTASDRAYEISETIGNVWGQAYCRYWVGYAYWDRGQPQQAIEVMAESIRLSQVAGFITPQVITRAQLGLVYGGLGAIEKGLETARLALAEADRHHPPYGVHVLGVLTHLHLWAGDLTEAEAALTRAKSNPDRENFPIYYVIVRLADGHLALRQGDYGRVMTITDEFLTIWRPSGMRAHLPDVLALQGRALLGQGHQAAARDRLQEARQAAEAIGSQRALWPILTTLSQLSPDPTEAAALRQQAQNIVETIAAHISDTELRTSFLDQVEGRAAF